LIVGFFVFTSNKIVTTFNQTTEKRLFVAKYVSLLLSTKKPLQN